MTRETLDNVIDKILEMHRLGQEVDEVVYACGLPEPRLHLMILEEFMTAAELLNDGNFEVRDTGSDPFRYHYQFTYRGVDVFKLEHTLRSITKVTPD